MRNCTLFVTETDLTRKGAEGVEGGDRPEGHPFNDAETTSVDFASKLDTSNPLGGSCPAGRAVTVAGQSVVIITSALCDSFALIGVVLQAVGALVAMFIVFRG